MSSLAPKSYKFQATIPAHKISGRDSSSIPTTSRHHCTETNSPSGIHKKIPS
ncbi:hypothetical protein KC19_VG031800 [Ceratodon purpureus]|uniref:Uncharacterized protein n=1 Tax=Ceratodon purpureus TaxID=3225 RepID=A0A8T0HLG7_CERPU|nr:hypothetical protein KC19_VG031800 [Ceratodon purpureus]